MRGARSPCWRACCCASFSIAVNWHRRVLLGEKPAPPGAGCGSTALVWRYIAWFRAAAPGAGTLWRCCLWSGDHSRRSRSWLRSSAPPPSPWASRSPVLFGLSALFTFYRLSELARGHRRRMTGPTRWAPPGRATRKNRVAYLVLHLLAHLHAGIAGAVGCWVPSVAPSRCCHAAGPWPAAFAAHGRAGLDRQRSSSRHRGQPLPGFSRSVGESL